MPVEPSLSQPKFGTVLFIDDEDEYFAERYQQQLEVKFDVNVCTKAVDALELLSDLRRFCAVVIDVMMPHPPGKGDATDDGMLTGVWLVKQRLDQFVRLSVPVILLTNRGLEPVQTALQSVNFPKGLIEVYRKLEVPGFRLPRLVEQLARHWVRIQ